MTDKEVCEAAARYIEEHGWTKGAFERSGKVCLMGAIRAVLTGSPNKCPNDRKTMLRIGIRLKNRLRIDTSIIWWNDRQKSRKPVLALLRSID